MNLDLIFSIGPACRPAYHLKQNFLRFFSSPLDYQMEYSLDTVLHLFQTSFSDFFSEIKEDTSKKGAHNNRRVIDVKNSIISLHHFDSAIPLPEAQKQFRDTMTKRFDILHNAIINSDTIGLICNRDESVNELSTFLKTFAQLYPNQHFILINVRHNEFIHTIQERVYPINKKLSIIDYEGYDAHPKDANYDSEFWIGNASLWNTILDEYFITSHPFIAQIQQWMKQDKKIIFYGAGVYCRKLLHFLNKYHITPEGIAVTEVENNPNSLNDICIKPINSYLNLMHHSVVIITVINSAIQQEIKRHLTEMGFDYIVSIDDSFRILY